MKPHTLTGTDELAILIARVLIGGFFALSGANNLLSLSDSVATATEAGLPAAGLLVFVGALTKAVVGILVIIDLQTKNAAVALIAYIVFSSLFFYGPGKWDDFPMAEPIFWRSLAVLGGILYLYAYSRGVQEMAEYRPKPKTDRSRRRRRRSE